MALDESGGCFMYCCFLLSPNAYVRCQLAPHKILVLQSSSRFVGFVSWLGNNKTKTLGTYSLVSHPQISQLLVNSLMKSFSWSRQVVCMLVFLSCFASVSLG